MYNSVMKFLSIDEEDAKPVSSMQAMDGTMGFLDPFMMMGGGLGLLGVGGTDFSGS